MIEAVLKPYVPDGVSRLDDFLVSEEGNHPDSITCPSEECGRTLTLSDQRIEWLRLQMSDGSAQPFIVGGVPGYRCDNPCNATYFRGDILDRIAAVIQEDLTNRGVAEIYQHPENVRPF